jgi:hypothetical protein
MDSQLMGFVVFLQKHSTKKFMNLKEEKCIQHFSETFFGYRIVLIK